MAGDLKGVLFFWGSWLCDAGVVCRVTTPVLCCCFGGCEAWIGNALTWNEVEVLGWEIGVVRWTLCPDESTIFWIATLCCPVDCPWLTCCCKDCTDTTFGVCCWSCPWGFGTICTNGLETVCDWLEGTDEKTLTTLTDVCCCCWFAFRLNINGDLGPLGTRMLRETTCVVWGCPDDC